MPYLKKATDAPFGLMPYTAPLRVNSYPKATTTTIYAGDIVTALATGLVNSLPTIDGSNQPIVGVAAETTTSASAGATVMVYDHPDQLYVIQDDDVGTAIAETHLGTLFAVTGLNPGTAAQVTRGRSITQMDTSTTTATAGVGASMLRFVRLHEIESGSYPSSAGSPRKCVVQFLPSQTLYATQSGAI